MRGVLLLASALLILACMDATTKLLSATYAVPMIVAARYTVGAFLMATVMGPRHGIAIIRTRRTGLVVVRGVCLAAASLFFGLGLQRIGVAEATAIGFLAPILVMLVAGAVLRERVGPLGWIATALGFGGVLLIARPSGGLDPVGVSFVLAMVGLASSYQLLSRSLARTETTLALTFVANLVGAVLFGCLLPWFWPAQVPSARELAMLVALGCFSSLGHYMLTTAYRYAPASLLSPANYVQMLWAGVLSLVVFAHVPDALSLAGMATIAASGIITGLRSHRLARETAAGNRTTVPARSG